MQLLWKRRGWRNGHESYEPVDLVRLCRQEVPVPAYDVKRIVEVVEDRPCVDSADWVAAKRERGDDTEIAAAATDRPEQVGLALGVRLHSRTVGEDDPGRQQIVDRQPETPGQIAAAAAGRKPADTGSREDADGNSEAMLVRRGVNLPELHPALNLHAAGRWVNRHRIERGQI